MLSVSFSSAIIDKMVTVYKDPDDVDLFVGGILENRVGTGALGPTFRCLVAERLVDLLPAHWSCADFGTKTRVRFNENQLEELRKVSLGRTFAP